MRNYTLTVEGIPVEVCHKNVKNLNLRIYPPNGEVRLSAPFALNEEKIRLFLGKKIGWIRQKQAEIRRQAQVQEPSLHSLDEIEILGEKIRVRRSDRSRKTSYRRGKNGLAEVTVGRESSDDALIRFLEEMALETLKEKIPPLIAKWQQIIGVQVREWRVRRMKTRWGSCNPQARRIWLNAELAKKSLECLEYVIVHEMVHLIERRHNAHFYHLMDRFLPAWRELREKLRKQTVWG